MWDGYAVSWDLSKLRPQGARLKTFGGRSSGPGPLDETLHFIQHMVEAHRDRKLSSLNAFDIVTKIANSVVVGGVRRSSIITLSDGLVLFLYKLEELSIFISDCTCSVANL